LKTLSITQPWADLILAGHKTVENRRWNTPYRGPLLIHAPQGYDFRAYSLIQQNKIALAEPGLALRSGIIGICDLIGVSAPGTGELSNPWRDPAQYAFILDRVHPFHRFYPMGGHLNLWKCDPAGPLAEEIALWMDFAKPDYSAIEATLRAACHPNLTVIHPETAP